jgi:hypothetical protein
MHSGGESGDPGTGEPDADPLLAYEIDMQNDIPIKTSQRSGEFVVRAAETYGGRLRPYSPDELQQLKEAAASVVGSTDRKETEQRRAALVEELRSAASQNGAPGDANAIKAIRSLLRREHR